MTLPNGYKRAGTSLESGYTYSRASTSFEVAKIGGIYHVFNFKSGFYGLDIEGREYKTFRGAFNYGDKKVKAREKAWERHHTLGVFS